MSTWLIVLIVLIVIAWILVMKYNWMISLRNKREQAFGDIDVQLKLRFDLVPNLINTVKWYAKHEQETLNQIVEARNLYQNAKSIDSKVAASNMLSGALGWIFALAESYPDLKANTNFVELQRELSDIENKIAAARRFFNAATTEYNTYIQMFPNNIIAKMFGFKEAELFKIEDDKEKEVVKVEF